MAGNDQSKFVIVGGGLGGSLLAAYLGRSGHAVDLYEMRGDPRTTTIPAGRSINLALSHRGLCALDRIGLVDDVLARTVPMTGRMIHSVTGKLSYQPYGLKGQANQSVMRGELNSTLLSAAQRCDGVRLFFHHKCTGLDVETGAVHITNMGTGQRQTVEGATVIGADGAFSAIRRRMQRLPRFNYQQDYLTHGYKELTIPPDSHGQWMLHKNALHIWPRRSLMMIALPNLDGSFTCTLFWPFEGAQGFAAIRSPADLLGFFQDRFPDAVSLMPTLVEDYFHNPTGSLVTIRCHPWHVGDKVVLLGDACHAVVPFYGQGMNAAFEDVMILTECLERLPSNRQLAFETYQRMRKVDTDALADLSLANFIEMRDHTGSRVFLVKKKMGQFLHRLLGRWYQPLYTMVTYTSMPYARVVRRAAVQKWIARMAAGAMLFLLLLLLWLVVVVL